MNLLSKTLLIALAIAVGVAIYYGMHTARLQRKVDLYERAILVGKVEASATLERTAELLREAEAERARRIDLQARYDTLDAQRQSIHNESHPRPRTVPALRDSILRASGQ